MNKRPVRGKLLVFGLAVAISCQQRESPSKSPSVGTQASVAAPLSVPTPQQTDFSDLTFTDPDGREVPIKKYLEGKSLVLVFTRGYFGSFCMYCATQTSRLIANYDKFASKNAEVVVVFPVRKPRDQTRAQEFWRNLKMEEQAEKESAIFPFLLDLELEMVKRLGIEENLAKPSTYILDSDGKVHFAYIGANHADRPSIKVLLDQLDAINHEKESVAR
ncbi:MAG: redoxin domain-containing protein [Planctomycetota bacterium]